MKFSGRLQIEADPVEWLKTDLSLAQGRLELTSGAEVLGSWSMSQVKAERIEGDRFELLLGDDRALFAADDALAFSYEALPHLTKKHIIAGPTGLRGRLRNSLRSSERRAGEPKLEESPPVGQPTAERSSKVEADSINHPVARRLRDLMEAAGQDQAAQRESSIEAVQNGARGETDEDHHAEHTLHETAVEEGKSVSEFADVDPLYEFEADLVSAEPEAETTSAGPEVRPTSFPEPEPTDLVLTSPPRPNGIRLDLEPAFARASSRDDEPEDWVMVALEGLLEEVRKGSMTPAQVGAITDLVQAVTDLVAARRGRPSS